MSNSYKITTDDILNAKTYVPTVEKMEFIRHAAERCFDRLDITANSNEAGINSSLPSCFKVNTDRRSRYLMAAFMKMYLGRDIDTEDDDEWLMSIPQYDMYAEHHPFEQMNRFKTDKYVKDKCFDLMSDYSELKYRLDSDIKGLMEAMNDTASRVLAYIEASSSPIELKKTLDAMNENQELLDNYMKERENSEAEEL